MQQLTAPRCWADRSVTADGRQVRHMTEADGTDQASGHWRLTTPHLVLKAALPPLAQPRPAGFQADRDPTLQASVEQEPTGCKAVRWPVDSAASDQAWDALAI